jgi:hypothetical protein
VDRLKRASHAVDVVPNVHLGAVGTPKNGSSAKGTRAPATTFISACFSRPLDLASWGDHCLRRQKIHMIFDPRIVASTSREHPWQPGESTSMH